MKKKIKINKKFIQKNLFVKNFIEPILFVIGIYILGCIPIFVLSSFFPFFLDKEYLFIFIFFVIALNGWAHRRWKQDNIWEKLGFAKIRDQFFTNNFRKELFKSFFIIFFWCLLLLFGGYIRFETSIYFNFLFDILFTAIFVGVAEELLFRVWLFEELNQFFSRNKSIIVQSIIFALVHSYNFDESFFINFLMKFGLFLLGIYLNLLRINHYSNIFPSIAFHGGIVGFIFLAKSFLQVNKHYPSLIYGSQYDNFINPISGFIGIFTLLCLNFHQIKLLNQRNS